jgi:threonine/homoserine/homoserine lactone efflux protein
MALLAVFLSAWMVGFSGAMAPGPISTIVVSEASRRGFWVGPLVTLGHAVAELVIVVALVLGLRDLLAGSQLQVAIALVGGCFLVWIGLTTTRDALRSAPALALSPAGSGGMLRWGPAWAGLVTSFSNPYWFLWWGTIGASYVVVSLRLGTAGAIAFYGGHIMSDLSWNSLLSLLMASGRRWLPAGVVRGFLAATGAFMMGLGIYFVLAGWRML